MGRIVDLLPRVLPGFVGTPAYVVDPLAVVTELQEADESLVDVAKVADDGVSEVRELVPEDEMVELSGVSGIP